LHASERDTEAGRLRRQAWWQQISQIDPQQLVFLDESGVTTEMTRRYGRALRGERVREGAPAGHWHTLTLLGAISLEGVVATMTIESPTDSDVFLSYVEQVLCPRLRPGQVVVMDNLSAHKNSTGRDCIEQTGARLLYLPPYSPDFNPIEQCWAKIKEHLRIAKARLLDILDHAVSEAISTVTAQNAAAWFHHSGYGVQQL
jgi:transposase